MLNIGFWELFLIVVVGLLVIGPNELPKVAKSVTRAFRKLRRTGDDLRDSARKVVDEVIPPEELYGDDEPPDDYGSSRSYLPPPEPEPPKALDGGDESDDKSPKDGDGSLAS